MYGMNYKKEMYTNVIFAARFGKWKDYKREKISTLTLAQLS
jgi:hypothetical protein